MRIEPHEREPLGVAATALLAMLAVLLLGGCVTWPDRVPHTAMQARTAIVPGYEDIRYWANAPTATFAPFRATVARQRPAGATDTLLALSGGADDGAYAAGLLKGWSETGERPEFTIVSGVSTGALIAPFAFLGSSYDDRLRRFYTGISRSDVFRRRGLVGLVTQPSVADTEPLRRLIAANVDERLLVAIAAEHRRGRRLLVQTTDLDAARGVVWDMGAIAASARPDRLALFRRVLLASASVPGLFTPVLIDVASGGSAFKEMHVDGATMAGFFTLPQSLLAAEDDTAPLPDGTRIFVVLNGRLSPEYEVVEPSTFAIVGRALSTVLAAYDRASILNVQQFAARRGVALSVTWIGDDFARTSDVLFSREYMAALYDYGVARGRGDPWRDRLPEE